MDALINPSLPVAIVEVIIGLFLLARAADEFVEGAVGLASTFRISPVVIGAVIVGFGTSAPELLVSGIFAMDGDLDSGIGNIAGSNVANLTLVLGAAAVLVVLKVTPGVLAREAPLSLLAVLLFAFFTMGGLARWEGIVLLVVLAGILFWLIVGGKSETNEDHSLNDEERTAGSQALRTLIGLVGTVLGAQLLVWGALAIADIAGLTGGFIGFTLVALGTSLPELVTAVVAARKGETELILGNLMGSNIFNSLAVGGVVAVIAPGPIDDRALATIGMIGMAAVATVAWIFLVTRKRVHRIEAFVLFAAWLASVALMANEGAETALSLFGA